MRTIEQFASERSRALSEIPLTGRARELAKLLSFVSPRTPALVCGSSGMGKTRLLHEIERQLSADGTQPIYIRFRQPLHAFLLELAKQLGVNCSSQSSIALRGALWNACETGRRVFLLDDIADATLPYYRFLERVLANKGNAIIGAAAHEYATRALHRIFWNPHFVIKLQPLNKADAETLAGSALAAFVSDHGHSPDFAKRVLEAARGNPGRIVEMCIRAGNPAYRTGDDRIRFGALVMDSVTGMLP